MIDSNEKTQISKIIEQLQKRRGGSSNEGKERQKAEMEKDQNVEIGEFSCMGRGLRRTKTLNNIEISTVKSMNLFDDKLREANWVQYQFAEKPNFLVVIEEENDEGQKIEEKVVTENSSTLSTERINS